MAKHRVIRLHGVPLGQDEPVAVGVVHAVRRDAQMARVQDHERVDHAHVAADVTALAGHDNVDAVATQVPPQRLKLLDSCHR